MKLKKLVNTFLLTLLILNLCFAFVPFEVEIREAGAQGADWYNINADWINVTTTNYFNMSIHRSNTWISHCYWKNRASGEWVDVYPRHLVATETETWQYY